MPIMVRVDVRSPEATINQGKRERAVQRALTRGAHHFHSEFRKLVEELHDPNVKRHTTEARAKLEIRHRHEKTFQRYLVEELDVEGYVPLQRGAKRSVPCGTSTAYQYHRDHKQEPCALCLEWFDNRLGTEKCRVCLGEFVISQPRQIYCSDQCKWLWHACLKYRVQWSQSRVYNAHSILKHRSDYDEGRIRHAKSVLAEYRDNGVVVRRRNPNKSGFSEKALVIAREVGIDLDATVKRLVKEFGG